MLYAVFLQRRSDGTYHASVPAMPGITAVGETREGTVQAVEQSMRTVLETGEFVFVEFPDQPPAQINPWLATAGILADDPTMELLLPEIYAARDAE
jgi:predicted RNase H-like HicB family nuclease